MPRLAFTLLCLTALASAAHAQDCPDGGIPLFDIPLDTYCETEADCAAGQRCELITTDPFRYRVVDPSRKMCNDFSGEAGEDCDWLAQVILLGTETLPDGSSPANSTTPRMPSPGCLQNSRLDCVSSKFNEAGNTLRAQCKVISVGKGESCPLGRHGVPFCAALDPGVNLYCNPPPGATPIPGPGPGGAGGGFVGNGTCFENAGDGAQCGDDVFAGCDSSQNLQCRNGVCVSGSR
jgi:hypothetical protein